MKPLEEIRLEQIAQNLRFYAEARFKQLALLMSWLALALAGITHKDVSDNLTAGITTKQAVAATSLLFTAVMWVMEVKATLFWRAHRDHAPELWPRKPQDSWYWINATNAVLLLHVGLYAFWVWYGAVQFTPPQCFLTLSVPVGLLLFVYSVIQYTEHGKLPEEKAPPN